MRIWLVKTGEPLPITGNERLLRMGMIANILWKRGHEVTWWTSTFDHVSRAQRDLVSRDVIVNERYRIKMLYSPGYKQSISLSRIWDHYVLGRVFGKAIQTEPQPDIILCALPTLELSAAATNYGIRNNIPVILDLRDMWPDIFVEPIPALLRPLAKALLNPMFRMVREACTGATALIGITDDFVDWGLRYAGRSRTDLDRAFPLAYQRNTPNAEAIHRAIEFWRRFGVGNDRDGRLVFCFFGTMGHQLDMETVIEAARRLQEVPAQFVLCGSGDNLDHYKRIADGCTNVVFPGWVGAAEIWTLMRMSTAGLAPYRNSFSFMRSIPNKAIEYLSAGLPIITCLDGRLRTLIRERACGYWYPSGDSGYLASLISGLCTSYDELRDLRENASSVFDQLFDAEKVYGQLVDYLEDIVRTRGTPRGLARQ